MFYCPAGCSASPLGSKSGRQWIDRIEEEEGEVVPSGREVCALATTRRANLEEQPRPRSIPLPSSSYLTSTQPWARSPFQGLVSRIPSLVEVVVPRDRQAVCRFCRLCRQTRGCTRRCEWLPKLWSPPPRPPPVTSVPSIEQGLLPNPRHDETTPAPLHQRPTNQPVEPLD